MKPIWIIVALLAGSFLPIQAGLNARLGKAIESPIQASLVSFIVGGLALLSYILIARQQVSLVGLKSAPVYLYVGGVLGAFTITGIVLAFPKIGAAMTFGLVVTGQMVISVLLDQFNILVSQQQSINTWKVFGIALIVTGVIVIRKF